jgi:hypothetical protein
MDVPELKRLEGGVAGEGGGQGGEARVADLIVAARKTAHRPSFHHGASHPLFTARTPAVL